MKVQCKAQRLHLPEEHSPRMAAYLAGAVDVRLVVVRDAQMPVHAAREADRARERSGHEAVLVLSPESGCLVMRLHTWIIPGARMP